jgi:hypothetical protein
MQGVTMMTVSSFYLPEVVSCGDRLAPLRSANWLSLGAAPTFAFMAALTGILGGGAHDVLCTALSHTSAANGMVTMYTLMSVFHFAPWLKLLLRWEAAPAPRGLCVRPVCSSHRE